MDLKGLRTRERIGRFSDQPARLSSRGYLPHYGADRRAISTHAGFSGHCLAGRRGALGAIGARGIMGARRIGPASPPSASDGASNSAE